jgi:hypothetical protein
MTKRPNPKRNCIFYRPGCGRVTKEDVWPTWLTQYVPRDLKDYSMMIEQVHPSHSDTTRQKIDGDPRSRRVKFVCGSCNNGWMSELQNRAKPYVLPLVQGSPLVLRREAQETLATWCAMSVMTSDFFYPQRPAIPQSDRDYLRSHWKPPPATWKIWIGRYVRKNWQAHWVKNAMPLEYDGRVPALSADGLPMPNTQATTIVFGQLYVHAFSSIHPSLVSIISIEKLFEKIAQVWPVQEEFIAWPTKPMTDRDADNIQGAICEALEGLSRYSK